jgi:hypothetical protein
MGQVTGPPVGPKLTITVAVDGVAKELIRLDLDADKVACVAPSDPSDFGRFVARDDSGRLWSVAGFEMLLRETGRPIVVVDAFGARPALWGRPDESVNLDADAVDGMADRLSPTDRDRVELFRKLPAQDAAGVDVVGTLLRIVDKLAPKPKAPPPRSVVLAAERAALDIFEARQ